MQNSCSVSLFVGTLFRSLLLIIIVLGFVEANEESCVTSFWPIYVILVLLNIGLIGGIIYLSVKMFSSKANNKGENKEDKKEDQKELKEEENK